MTLPTLQVNVDRIFPFAPKIGSKKGIIQNINLQYSVRGENRITTTDSLFFKKEMFDDAQAGFQHNIPLATNFKLFKYLSLSASTNYQEVWTFETIESDADSAVSRSENSSFADDVFASMDDDGSGVLSLNEFCTWGFGLHETADNAEQTDAFEIAMQVVFTPWDQDANAQVTPNEYTTSLCYDFQRTDLDENGTLTPKKYRSGFSVVVTARAAIHSELTHN